MHPCINVPLQVYVPSISGGYIPDPIYVLHRCLADRAIRYSSANVQGSPAHHFRRYFGCESALEQGSGIG